MASFTANSTTKIFKLRQDDFCWSEPHIPNVISGIDVGTRVRSRTFCALPHIVIDNYIPPPIMFNYDIAGVVKPVYVESSDIPLHKVATTFPLPGCVHHCNYIPCSGKNGSLNAVGVCKRTLQHIVDQHSVCNASAGAYAADRTRHSFEIGVGKGVEKSAFIDRSLVLPLILSTIQNPDKISPMTHSDRYSLERRFDVEIGHTFETCCYVTRVIVKKVTHNINKNSATNYYEIVSAYPVSTYYCLFT